MATTELEFLITAKDEASKKLEGLKSTAAGLGKVFLGAGVAMVGALALSVKAASEAQQEMARVDAVVSKLGDVAKEAGMSLEGLRATFVKAGNAAVKLGFDDEQAALSIANLTRSTGSLEMAQKAQGLAMDLARAKNIDLEQATKMVNMALQGSPKLLREFGIAIEEGASKAEILTELQNKVGGTAEAMKNTLGVQMEILNVQFGNLKESIGGGLLPILTTFLGNHVIPLIERLQNWREELTKLQQHPLVQKLMEYAAIIGDFLKPAIDVLIPVLQELWRQLQELWKILSPVLLPVLQAIAVFLGATLVGAIAIAIGSLILIAGTINVLIKGLQSLIVWLADIVLWFQKTIPEALKILTTAWDEGWSFMRTKTEEVANWIQSKIDAVIGAFNRAKEIASSPLQAASGAISSVVSKIGGMVKGRAGGGFVGEGNPFMVGERGAELFVPQTNGRIVPAGMGGMNITITGNTFMGDRDAAVMIGDLIMERLKLKTKVGL